jgi:type II secretory pathway component PulF
MPLYQATVAKNNQKVSLSLEQNSKELAREYLHNQGYSILSLEEKTGETGDTQKTKSFFFVVRVQGQEKK